MIPKKANGFVQLGVVFPPDAEPDGRNQLTGRCPFCGKDNHFQANAKTLLWDCKRCGNSGNFEQFLALRAESFAKALVGSPLLKLKKSRGLKPETLKRWGVGWIAKTEHYTIPLRSGKRVVGIHRYDLKHDKMISTTGGNSGFIHAKDLDLTAGDVDIWICEGEWDGLALDEVMQKCKRKDAVISICGAGGMSKTLAPLLSGFRVILALDNDDPGRKGDERARKFLVPIAKDVASIHWPPGREDGFDVRDMRSEFPTKPNTFLVQLEKLAQPEPRAGGPSTDGSEDGKPADPDDWAAQTAEHILRKLTGKGMPRNQVIKEYRKWLYMPDSDVFDVLFGSIFANRLDGDPLWLFLVGPPGCGKSALIMSLSKSPLMAPSSTFTPAALISGKDNIGMNDPSLIPMWNGRVVSIKDFTTILQCNPLARDEIFAILRDAYDGRIEKHFGTGTHRKYNSRFGIIAGVTSKIEELGSSHTIVGERFVKFYMKSPGILDVGGKVINVVIDNLGRQTEMQRELEDIAKQALDRPVAKVGPKIGKAVRNKFVKLAQWTAAMRGAVSRDRYKDDVVLFRPIPEIGTRLALQLCKLAQGIAIFRGHDTVGLDEYRIISRVARDSAPDLVELFVGELYTRRKNDWATVGELSKWTHYSTQTVISVLRNLALLRVVHRQTDFKPGSGGQQFKLSASMIRLMRELNLYADERRFRRVKPKEHVEVRTKVKAKLKAKKKRSKR